MNYSDASERLCAEMTQILLQHHGVPSDFVATVAVKADPDAVKNARETTVLTGGIKCFMCFCGIPLALLSICGGILCSMKNTGDLMKELVDGAENDIYVYGDAGFAVVNSGKVKKWTPMKQGLMLFPDLSTFDQSQSGCCGGSSEIKQAVLFVQQNPVFGHTGRHTVGWGESDLTVKFKSGKIQQCWFVGPNDMSTLPMKCGGMGGMTGGMGGMGAMAGGMGGMGAMGGNMNMQNNQMNNPDAMAQAMASLTPEQRSQMQAAMAGQMQMMR